MTETTAEYTGRKDDQDKPDWSLLPLNAIEQIVKVMDFGAKKYERDNWKDFPREDARKRYSAALMRHLAQWQSGESTDPDSGLSHISHIACNALFLLWYEMHGGID